MMHIRSRRILAAALSAALIFTSLPAGVSAGEVETENLTVQDGNPEAMEVRDASGIPDSADVDEQYPADNESADLADEEIASQSAAILEVSDPDEEEIIEIVSEDADDPEPEDSILPDMDLSEDPENSLTEEEESLFAAEGDEYAISFDGMRSEDGQGTWVYIDEELEIPVNTDGLGELTDYYMTCTSGHVEGDGDNIEFIPYDTDGVWIGEDDGNWTVYVDGGKLKEDIPENGLFVSIAVTPKGQEGGPDTDYTSGGFWLEIRESKLDFHWPINDHISLLPHWSRGINKNFDCWIENAFFWYGEDIPLYVESMPWFEPDEGVDPDCVTIEPWDDGNGWEICAKHFGSGTVMVPFRTDKEHLEDFGGTYEVRVNVGEDVWELWMDSSTHTFELLPGASLELTATCQHNMYDPEEDAHSETHEPEGVSYIWETDDSFDQYFDLIINAQDPKVCTVTAKVDADFDWDARSKIWVIIRNDRGEELCRSEEWIRLSDLYWVLDEPLNLPSPVAGKTITISPKVNEYSSGHEPINVTYANDIRFRWDNFDEKSVEIRDTDNKKMTWEGDDSNYGKAPFTLKRLENGHTHLCLVVEKKDAEDNWNEVCRRDWDLDEIRYEVWFEDDNDYRVFSDEKNHHIGLKREYLDNIEPDNYELVWTIGLLDEKDNFIQETIVAENDGYTVDEDGMGITLDGSELIRQADDGYLHLRVQVFAGNKATDQANRDLDIREVKEEYRFEWEEEEHMLPDWDKDIHRWLDVYVENGEFPDGMDDKTQILDVTVENEDIVSCEKHTWINDDGEEDYDWYLRAKDLYGSTDVNVRYRDIHGNEQITTFRICVDSDVYHMNVYTQDGADKYLPGSKTTLIADVWHHVDEEPDQDISGVTYRWTVREDSEKNVFLLDENGEEVSDLWTEDNQVQIRFRNLEEGEEDFWEDVWIDVCAFEGVELDDDGDEILDENGLPVPVERVRRDIRLILANQYLDLYPYQINSNLQLGSTQPLNPQVREYPSDEAQGYHILGQNDGTDVRFRWEYDENRVEILDEEGQTVDSDTDYAAGESFTLKRLSTDDSNIHLIAEIEFEDGNRDEQDRWYHLDGLNYDMWFEEGGDVFTDGVRTFRLNKENLDGVEYSLEVVAGDFWGDDEGWKEYYDEGDGWSFDKETGILSIDGAAMAEKERDNINVRVCAYIDGFEEPISDEWFYADICEPEYWGFPFGDEQLFPNEQRSFKAPSVVSGDSPSVRVRDSAFPDGANVRYVVENITIDSDPDEYDTRDAVTREHKGDEWIFTAVRGGRAELTATIKLYAENENGDPDVSKPAETIQYTWEYWVGDLRAWIKLSGSDGTDRVLAGQEFTVVPSIGVEVLERDGGWWHPTDTDRYEIEYDDVWVDEVYDDDTGPEGTWDWEPQDDGTLKITTEANAPDMRLRIRACLMDHNDDDPEDRWPIAENEFTVEVGHDIYKIETKESWNPDVIPGISQTVTPRLMRYTDTENEATEVTDNVFFGWRWYEGDAGDPRNPSHVIITDADGNRLTSDSDDGEDHTVGKAPFTVERVVSWNADFNLVAYGYDRKGRVFEYSWKQLNLDSVDPELQFISPYDDRGNENYTWVYPEDADEEGGIKILVNTDEESEIGKYLAMYPDQAKVVLQVGLNFDYENGQMIPVQDYTFDEEGNPTPKEGDGSTIDFSGYLISDGDQVGLDLSGWTKEDLEHLDDVLSAQDEHGICIHAAFCSGGYIISEREFHVYVHRSYKEMEDDGATTMVGSRFVYKDCKAQLWVDDKDHATQEGSEESGQSYTVTITDIVSDHEDILKPEYNKNENTWYIRAVTPGDAQITYTFTGYPDEETSDTHTTTLHVSEVVYDLSLVNDKNEVHGRYSVLLNGEITVYPMLTHIIYDVDKEQAGEDPFIRTDITPNNMEEFGITDYTLSFHLDDDSIISADTDAYNSDKTKGLTVHGLRMGRTNAWIEVVIEFDDGHREEPRIRWDTNFSVETNYALLDLSGDTLYVTPGQVIGIGEMDDIVKGKYTLYSMQKPEGDAGLNPDFWWFDDAEPECFDLPVDEHGCGYELTVRENALADLRVGETSLESWIHVGSNVENGPYGGGTMKVVIHEHQGVHTPAVEATYTHTGSIEYWTCSVCGKHFSDEECTKELTQEEINTPVPVKPVTDVAEETNLVWSIQDGVLSVNVQDSTKSAQMKNFSETDPAPWTEAANELGVDIKKIVVAEGVTNIGDNAFAGLDKVEDISLPKSLESISPSAFESSVASSANISFPGTESQWKDLTDGTDLAGNTTVKPVHEHTWSDWETISPATIFKAEQQKRTCSGCGETETRANGKKLRATIRLSAISGQIAAGKKVQIAAQILPGNVKNYPLRWTSSNTSVATVSATGLVSVNKKAGGKSVVITAISRTDASERASFTINVMKGAVKKIAISGKKTVKAGKSVKLKAKVTTTKGKANKKLQWTSSNTAWATVAANGKVTTTAAGKGKKVTITAMATDGSGKKKTFKIKIK